MPIEQVAPELERIVSLDQETEELGSGYGGDRAVEGPVWWKERGSLLFSDIGNSRRMKWAPGEGVTVFRESTNGGNGMTRDPQGRLIVCEDFTRRVVRFEPDESTTVLAYNYQGKLLNRPNDVVVKSDGSIYFSDINDLRLLGTGLDLDFNGVYRISPDIGNLTLVARDFLGPNGLAFSPDENILYINDTRRRHIRAFAVQPSGALSLASDRVFCDLRGDRPGIPDGMKVDMEGNVYCGGSGGIWVIDPSGKHLGTIVHGQPLTTNMAWGDDDWQTMYYTTADFSGPNKGTLGRVRLKIPGVPVPRGQV